MDDRRAELDDLLNAMNFDDILRVLVITRRWRLVKQTLVPQPEGDPGRQTTYGRTRPRSLHGISNVVRLTAGQPPKH
jgi:hypothetical protein